MPFEEVPREFKDVLPPLPQRRHLDVDATQAVVEIEPESPLLDERGERSVRRTMIRVSTRLVP